MDEGLVAAATHGCKPEVRETKLQAVVGDGEVRGLDVPVAYQVCVQVRHARRLLHDEGLNVLRREARAPPLGTLVEEAVQVELAAEVRNNGNGATAVENCAGTSQAWMRREVPEGPKLVVDATQPLHGLDRALQDDLQGAEAESWVLGLEDSVLRGGPQLADDAVLSHPRVLVEMLLEIFIHGGDMLQGVSRAAPQETFEGHRQLPLRPKPCRLDIPGDDTLGLATRGAGPQERRPYPMPGGHLLAVESDDIGGARHQEGLRTPEFLLGVLRAALRGLVGGLCVRDNHDRHDRRRVREPVHGSAAFQPHLDVGAEVDYKDAFNHRSSCVDFLLRGGTCRHGNKANFVEIAALQLWLSEKENEPRRHVGAKASQGADNLLLPLQRDNIKSVPACLSPVPLGPAPCHARRSGGHAPVMG
mmetsp:Transcript_67755/g.209598  ORF Transcript_67755/g.209598 Transcript_67755/m.209598 type:complete len:417 (-) Transcript_67755:30-1280(-)